MISENIIMIKTAYVLKTPHVEFLNFFFGRSINTAFGSQLNVPTNIFDLVTLTYELDLNILPPDLHAKIQVCMSDSVRLVVRVVTDTHIHRHTMSKLLHPTRHRRGV